MMNKNVQEILANALHEQTMNNIEKYGYYDNRNEYYGVLTEELAELCDELLKFDIAQNLFISISMDFMREKCTVDDYMSELEKFMNTLQNMMCETLDVMAVLKTLKYQPYVAKLFLNNLYGQFAKSNDSSYKYVYQVAQQHYDNFIYADTDSIHMMNKNVQEILANALHEQTMNNIEKYGYYDNRNEYYGVLTEELDELCDELLKFDIAQNLFISISMDFMREKCTVDDYMSELEKFMNTLQNMMYETLDVMAVLQKLKYQLSKF